MLKVLHLLPHLGTGGAARQVGLLAERLPRERFALHVAGLGRDGLFGENLRHTGTPADALGARHHLDFGAVVAWRRLLAEFQPDVIHAWQPGPCRFALVFARRPFCRAGRVFDAIASGVAVPTAIPDRDEFCRSLGIPAHARLIMTGGALRPGRGFREAVWTFDMLRYAAPNTYLVVLGDGPERAVLAAFVRAVACDDNRVRFTGERADAPALLALADVVWVPHGSASLAREAAAAGVPVVASRRPDLAAIVADGETGLLRERGRHVEWCRATLMLLADDARRRQLGEAARRRVLEQFDAARFAAELAAVYENRAGASG